MRKLILATASAVALGIAGTGPLYAQNTHDGSAGATPGAEPPAIGAIQPAKPNEGTPPPAMPSASTSNPSSDTVTAASSQTNGNWTKLSRADMQQIQEKLRSEGLYHGKIDGLNGSGTQQALRTYQRKNGLPVTGTPDPQTLSSLQISMPGVGSSTEPNSTEMNPSSNAGTSGTSNSSMPGGKQQ